MDGIRINFGNIGSIERVKMVVEKCKERNLKIRIGVNGGFLEKEFLKKYGFVIVEVLVESVMGYIKIFEDLDFYNIVIFLKLFDIYKIVDVYELILKKVDYFFYIGIIEFGSVYKGIIKFFIGVGVFFFKGIGDIVRIFLIGDFVEEVIVGK